MILVILISRMSAWSFYFKAHGWYWYMQTTFGFTISLLWRGGDQGCWGLNASSLDEIWWLKRHTDRSPNSLQRQLGLPDKLCLLQEIGLEMDVIVRNTKLRRCGGSPHWCFYSAGLESSRVLNSLTVKSAVIITRVTGNLWHLLLCKVALNHFHWKQMWSFCLCDWNKQELCWETMAVLAFPVCSVVIDL